MDKTVPPGAVLLLDFIGGIEAPKGYETIYGNNQHRLSRPVTAMTLAEILAAQPTWTSRYGSSATGRYQFMRATLTGLITELGLSRAQVLTPDLQDRLGYHLLKRRGYDAFMAGATSRTEFGKRLAQEWASLPVLAATKGGSRQVSRGQSYYAGDGLNKSLVTPDWVEALLSKVKVAKAPPTPIDWGDAAAITHDGVTLPKPAEPAPAIVLTKLPESPDGVGFWGMLAGLIAAVFKKG